MMTVLISNSHKSRANRAIKLGVVTIVAFFGGCGAWATMAPLDSAIVGGGWLAVRGNTKTVQHREGGTVARILVGDGDLVSEGQVLLELDGTQIRASMSVHQAQLIGDRVMYARNLAELSNADQLVLDSDFNPMDSAARSIVAREQAILTSHRSLLEQQLKIVDERVMQARKQLAGVTAQHVSAMRALAFGLQQLQAMTSLEHIGLTARNAVLELSRSLETLRGEVGQLESDIGRHEAEIEELKTERLRLRSSAQSDAARESREAQLHINDVLPRIASEKDLLSHLSIRAPVSGRVINMQVFTNGGVVEPGKPILQIVPDIRQIVAAAEIRPEDVEHVRLGQATQVIAVGFNTKDTQAIDGRILSISADRIVDTRTGRSFYSAEVSLMDDHQSGKLLKQLNPGMPIEVVVPVKARTMLEYLLEPLRTSLRSVGREI